MWGHDLIKIYKIYAMHRFYMSKQRSELRISALLYGDERGKFRWKQEEVF